MATASDRRLITLCERLAAGTTAGRAAWRHDGNDVFVWEHERGSVSIGSRDGDGQPPFDFSIYNPSGEKVEQLLSQLVDGDRPADWNDALAELYRVARRTALDADEIIGSLIEALPARGRDASGRFTSKRE